MPIRPFCHLGDALGACPCEAFTPNTNAVAQRLAAAEHQVEIGVRRINDERSGRFLGRVVDQLLLQVRR